MQGWKDGKMDRRRDGKMDRPDFIEPFWLPPGVQKFHK